MFRKGRLKCQMTNDVGLRIYTKLYWGVLGGVFGSSKLVESDFIAIDTGLYLFSGLNS